MILVIIVLPLHGLYAQAPARLPDGWPVATPSSEDFNQDSLNHLFRLIRETAEHPDFRALIVVRNGKLVVDEYFNSFWYTNIHDIRSAGKSVTSLLAGIAIDKGLIHPSDTVINFFPEYKKSFGDDDRKRKITVRDLLIMSPGLATDDYIENSPGREELMVLTEDFTEFVLSLPMEFNPGERYAYSSAVAFLLGVVVEQASGKKLEDFARENLFSPLGIKDFFWQTSPRGHTTGMGNLYLNARDFARIGYLMLNQGRWEGRQIVSEDWINQSFTPAFNIDDNDPFAHSYGYMWYLTDLEKSGKKTACYFASGNGGNKVFIIPEYDLVVVTLSSAYGQGYGQFRSHKILNLLFNCLEE